MARPIPEEAPVTIAALPLFTGGSCNNRLRSGLNQLLEARILASTWDTPAASPACGASET
jgi:hypothetical protein